MNCTNCDSAEKACQCETQKLRDAVRTLAANQQVLAWHLRQAATCDSAREELAEVEGSAKSAAAALR